MSSLILGEKYGPGATATYHRPLYNVRSPVSSAHSLSRDCSCYYCSSCLLPAPSPILVGPSSANHVRPATPRQALYDIIQSLHATVNRNTHDHNPHPVVFRNVPASQWNTIKLHYAGEQFKTSKFEYLPSSCKLIVVPLAKPFHDFAVPLMSDHVKMGMSFARLDTPARISSLKVNRQNLTKGTDSGGSSDREADCAVWTRAYVNGVVPTIVWEVGHTQKRLSLFKRAKMWCRRYNGMVRVVILVKFLRKNPLVDNAAILMVFRPWWRGDKWTAVQDGRVYQLFPHPAEAHIDSPADEIPLVYQDYFGPGNTGTDPRTGLAIDPDTPFNLPLDKVRAEIEDAIGVTRDCAQYRYPSGGSSVGGAPGGAPDEALGHAEPSAGDQIEVNAEARVDSPVEEEYEAFGADWDAAQSDLSDA